MNRNVVYLLVFLVVIVTSQTEYCLKQAPGSLKCEVCQINFSLNDEGECGLYTPIEGCSIYSSKNNGGCSSCKDRYIFNNGTCQLMIPHCAKADNVSTCTEC